MGASRKNKVRIAFILLVIGAYLGFSAHLNRFQFSPGPILPVLLWSEDGLASLVPPTLEPASPAGAGLGNKLYGPVAERDLPWYSAPPLDLTDLRLRYSANRFINAFRTTLPDPILQEEHNVTIAAEYLAGTVIEPGAIFSLNRTIGPRTKNRGFGPGPLYANGQIGTTTGGGICKVATTMYNLGVHSDLHLVERHPHSMPVPYVPPGRDATILWGLKDVRFMNNKDHPVLLWAEVKDTTLYIALYGQYDPPLVEWQREEMNRVPTWTIKRRNPNLAPGEIRSLEGAPGLTVRTWVEVEYPGGTQARRELGVDHYRPLPNYIEYGP